MGARLARFFECAIRRHALHPPSNTALLTHAVPSRPPLPLSWLPSGLFSKIGSRAFHQWADALHVYEGAPTPVTALCHVALVDASFARFFWIVHHGVSAISHQTWIYLKELGIRVADAFAHLGTMPR